MKKYLMTGIAAVALCAAFTSCSKETNLYNPDEIAQNEFEAKATKYKEAFVNAFGQPAANQDWGFGSYSNAARTRATINVNGNEWESCPELGDTEDQDVTAYVRALTTLPKVAPTGLENYYVTQVHCGTDTYTDLDNHSGILGSSKMNHLMIAQSGTPSINNGELDGDWIHINNFNRGDDTDWKGNTLVNDGGTIDFAYLGSEDSKYHNRWIAIDGANVPKTGGGNYAGYYYVCFDFEATNDYVQTVVQVSMPNPERETEIWTENYTFDGAYTAAMLAGREVDFRGTTYTLTTENTKVTQYVQGNKVVIGDDDYTDWIIRLVKATPKEEEKTVVRVIAEDMAGYTADDFDFNDVVFDCELDENEYVTKITLVHTGAEFSITVDGVEVHSAFGLPKNANRPQYWTMGSGNYSFTPKSTTYKVADIPVIATQIVEVKGEDGEIEYKTKDITLEAPKGLTTGKLAVGRDFGIIPERQSIDTYTNGKFSEYVKNSGVWNEWYK